MRLSLPRSKSRYWKELASFAFLYSLVAAKRFQALVALYAYCLTDNCLK